MSARTQVESWYHTPEFDAQFRRRRSKDRLKFARRGDETVADPAEVSTEARKLVEAYRRYFSGETESNRGARRGDPAMQLPECNDLVALADTFGASSERLSQAQAMKRLGLRSKAKRVLLCEKLGHRLDCAVSPDHRFYQPYLCGARFCAICGPSWFRQQFSDSLVALEPIVQHLLDEGAKHGREIVIAKIDFTVPNTGTMPTPSQVREFHEAIRLFWRAAERLFGISRQEYGQLGCDEFGGSKTRQHPLGNTNLHRHSVYVGQRLPQKNRELSAIWSIVWLAKEQRKEMFRFVRKNGVAAAWNQLEPSQRRFVSIKRAKSFRAALAHSLKYPAKFLGNSTPERLAELEAAFHRTRRFSTGGAFYNVKVVREPGEDSTIGQCPICGGPLSEIVEPWVSAFVLQSEGRRNIGEARHQTGRAKILSGASP